jgi:hypothetical protein
VEEASRISSPFPSLAIVAAQFAASFLKVRERCGGHLLR